MQPYANAARNTASRRPVVAQAALRKMNLSRRRLPPEYSNFYRKLDEVLEGVKEVKGELQEVKGELQEVKGELQEVKGELQEVKGAVSKLASVTGVMVERAVRQDIVSHDRSLWQYVQPCTLKSAASVAKFFKQQVNVDITDDELIKFVLELPHLQRVCHTMVLELVLVVGATSSSLDSNDNLGASDWKRLLEVAVTAVRELSAAREDVVEKVALSHKSTEEERRALATRGARVDGLWPKVLSIERLLEKVCEDVEDAKSLPGPRGSILYPKAVELLRDERSDQHPLLLLLSTLGGSGTRLGPLVLELDMSGRLEVFVDKVRYEAAEIKATQDGVEQAALQAEVISDVAALVLGNLRREEFGGLLQPSTGKELEGNIYYFAPNKALAQAASVETHKGFPVLQKSKAPGSNVTIRQLNAGCPAGPN